MDMLIVFICGALLGAVVGVFAMALVQLNRE
jgi:hypothetical protein